MQTELTHILEKWQKPELEEIGDAKQLIKEAKFAGFSDGVTFNGSPIGESSNFKSQVCIIINFIFIHFFLHRIQFLTLLVLNQTLL